MFILIMKSMTNIIMYVAEELHTFELKVSL